LLNLAITAILASLIVTVQVAATPEQSLFQPAKVECASAVAMSWVGRVKAQRCSTDSVD